jgi:hypothetical protein
MVADRFPTQPTGHVTPPASEGHLRSCLEELYGAALCALADPDPAGGYQAISQLSGHLAAMRRAVVPVARRQPGTGTWLVAACLASARQAEWALRRFECLLSGQSHAVRLPPGSIPALLEQRLGDYRAAEQAMLTRLDGWLTAAEHGQLAAGYRTAFHGAPTRPHPRCPHTGPVAGLMFRICARLDRVLDAVDSRPARPAAAGKGNPG